MKKTVSILLSSMLLALSLTFVACDQPAEGKSVSLKYADANAVMTMLIEDQIDYGLLPEPVATKLEKVKAPDVVWKRIDVQELYNSQTKAYPQAVLMVKNEVLNLYPQVVGAVQSAFADNVSWAKENPAQVITAVQTKFASTSLAPAKALTATTIDNCKINWQNATDAKESVNTYINEVLDVSVGLGITPAKRVSDDFFYATTTAGGNDVEGKTFTFVAPDGAPAIAIAKFINDGQNFVDGATFDYNVVNSEQIANYMNGVLQSADFIIMPLNSATLNHGDNYKLVSVVTHGNLYLMSKCETADINGLKDKTIGVIGEGKVPDLTLKTILKKNQFTFKTVV